MHKLRKARLQNLNGYTTRGKRRLRIGVAARLQNLSVDNEFSSALRTVLVEASTASWEFWFGLLEKFKEREGHCNVPIGHLEHGLKLSSWVSNQRSNKDLMTFDRVQKLNKLGFVWNVLKEKWEEGFRELQKFKEREGHLVIPVNYRTKHGKKLRSWLKAQRKDKDKLFVDQIARLNASGFIWDAITEKWEEGFRELQKFKEREGHCGVPAGYKTEDGLKLGSWVSDQRKNKDKLSVDLIKSLDAMGFIWDPLKEKWEKGFRELQKFKEREGHCGVRQNYKTDDGFKLGIWVSIQRESHGSMTQDRIDRLNACGFFWSAIIANWEDGFRRLQKFKELEGHCNVKRRYVTDDGWRLGNWVGKQRAEKDGLSPDFITKLDSIGFIWGGRK